MKETVSRSVASGGRRTGPHDLRRRGLCGHAVGAPAGARERVLLKVVWPMFRKQMGSGMAALERLVREELARSEVGVDG